MPSSTIVAGAAKRSDPEMVPQPNPRGLDFFTGSVAIDPLHGHQPSSEIQSDYNASVAMITFEPCARTKWHWHERGQFLTVIKGKGWICDKGQKPKRITAGDVIWCAPGVTHWHGADNGTQMMHMALSMGGVEWYESVGDEEYAAKGSSN